MLMGLQVYLSGPPVEEEDEPEDEDEEEEEEEEEDEVEDEEDVVWWQLSMEKEPVQLKVDLVIVLLTPAQCFPGMFPS